jgi:hypothetical protein
MEMLYGYHVSALCPYWETDCQLVRLRGPGKGEVKLVPLSQLSIIIFGGNLGVAVALFVEGGDSLPQIAT